MLVEHVKQFTSTMESPPKTKVCSVNSRSVVSAQTVSWDHKLPVQPHEFEAQKTLKIFWPFLVRSPKIILTKILPHISLIKNHATIFRNPK